MNFISTLFLLPSIILTLVLFCPLPQALGQGDPTIEFSSSLTPVGSGARALGMGGAFIAIADDATAASWNSVARATVIGTSRWGR